MVISMKIAVAGTGDVGLVAGVCFAEKGYDVTCVDVDEKKVEIMKSGISPIYEEGLEELMQKNNAAGTLHFTTNYQDAYKDILGQGHHVEFVFQKVDTDGIIVYLYIYTDANHVNDIMYLMRLLNVE